VSCSVGKKEREFLFLERGGGGEEEEERKRGREREEERARELERRVTVSEEQSEEQTAKKIKRYQPSFAPRFRLVPALFCLQFRSDSVQDNVL
jgi:hypothetical protein